LENAKLFDETSHLLKETEQRNAELAVINSVQEGLASELDIKAIYELVGEKMRNIFNAQVIDIVTYDPKLNLIEDQYSYEKGDRTLVGPREPKGFRKHVIETSELLKHNDNVDKAMVDFNNEILIGEIPKSQVYAPMIAGGKVKGVISLQNLDQENAFSDSDVSLLSTLVNSMTVALENARLFDETNRLLKETEQRTAELAVINSVQEGLASELDIKAIYEMVGEKMRNIFNPQVIDIVTYNAKENLIEDQYAYEKGDRTLLGAREPNGFRKYVIENKKTLVINKDMENERKAFDNAVVVGEGSKSIVLVPLITGEAVTGIISLQNLDQENAFPEANVNLLNTLANTMSVALENARLFDKTTHLLKETEQRTAELAVINSVQEGLAHELDIQAIYEMVGEKMREIFNAQVIDIVTYDADKNVIEDQYAYEKGDRTMLGPREAKGFRKHVIKTGQLLLHNENVEKAMREFNNEILIGETPKSQVYAPMMAGGKVKGVISLQNLDQEHAFSDADISLLSTLVNSMSVALQNARLFDETSRLLKETEQRTAELAVINSVQEGLANELDIQSIYDLVGDRIRDLFKAQAVVIATLDQEKGEEHFKYVLENGKRFHLEPRPLDKLRQHLIKTKQKIVINKDFEKAFANFGMKVAPGTELPQSTVYVPLIIGDKITSYVSLQNVDHENAFSDADVRLLETLANSMSVALENARLFDETSRLLKETEQRTAELAVINSVQEGLATELDIESIYNLVGERIQNIFDAQAVIIANLDLESKTEIFKFTMENDEKFNLEPRPFDKLRKHLVQTKQKVVINNSGEAFVWFGNKALPGTKPLQSGAFVPLIIGNKITSYISLQNVDKDNAFNESDIRLLETLANSMSVALENARLFDETNRLLKETEQRTSELAVINSVQEGLVREMDINAIYKLVGDRLCELFPDTQTLVIRTFDHKTEKEHFQYIIEKGVFMEEQDLPFNWANKLLIKTKQSLLINENYVELSMKYGGKGVTAGQPPKSAVFVPMIVGEDVKGSISLQNVDKENAFSESDLRLLTTLTNSMSVALENARLFDETAHLLKETEQRTAELAVINSVQDGLAKEMDMQGIYNLVGDRVQTLFKAQIVLISTFDLENKTEKFNYFFENNEKVTAETRPINHLRQLLIDKKHTIHIPTEEEAIKEYGLVPIGETKMPKSLLFVPLMTGIIIRGYVSLQNIDIENAFSDSDIRLLETLANSMSVALENARLFDETTRLLKETEQRTAELAVINSVQDGLAKEMAIQGIYDLVGEKIRDIFHAQVIDIVTYDKKNNLIEDRYSFEKGDRSLLGPRPLKGIRKHVIESGSTIVINNITDEILAKYDQAILSGEKAKSVVMVPMIAGGEINGVISLQNLDQENAFPETDVKLLNTLANSMSVALENARLFDETTRLLKETEQRTAELAVINSVQDGLAKEMAIQGIYDLVGEKIRDIFHAQVIDIVTYDKRNNLIEDRYSFDKGDRNLLGSRPLKGFRKHVIDSASTLVINNITEEIRSKYDQAVLSGEGAKSIVMVPMIAGGEINGVISLQNLDQENAFPESDVKLLNTLANSMSVALENARLFDETTRLLKETEQRTAELAVINSVQGGLAKELEIKGIYDLV
ncbi:MAG: GAF domain-containing protein, partial [Chitinophagaceae bacterium]